MDSPKTLLSDLTSSKVLRTLRRGPSCGGRPTPRKFSGFTLAELIVVVSILAILATIGFLALSGYQQDAKKAVAATNVNSVYTAISTEASVTGNSARYYVIHDPNYALTGSVIVFDNIPAPLVGGDWNAPGTNYSAGNPDYAKLKLDPAKFRITSVEAYASDLLAAVLSPFSVRSASADSVSADPSYLLVGAVDAADTSGTKTRVKSYSQVAAILPSGETQINGDYPVTATGGSTPGLIRDIANVGSSTGTLIDGATVGSIPGCDADSDFSGYAVPSMASGESKPVLKTTANGRINATATCSFGTVSIGSEVAACDPTYVPVSGLACAKNECGGAAPSTIPNAESNAVSQTLGTDWHYSATPGVCTYSCATTAPGYVWDTGSSSCKQNCDPVAAQTWSGTAYALSSIAALVHGASGNFSGSGSFGGSYPANGTLTADFALSCDNGTLSSVATPGTGTCNTNYTWNGNWTAPNCILDSYAVSGSFGAGGSGATVSGCSGASATADSSGTFSFANVPHGTACNDISAVRTGYLCATTTNGPSSLIANVTSIAGNCALTVNGACGTANKSYAYTATGYLSDSFCLSGTLSPASVAFPTAGWSTSWSCLGVNNGTDANCSASRAQAPTTVSWTTPGTYSWSVPASFSSIVVTVNGPGGGGGGRGNCQGGSTGAGSAGGVSKFNTTVVANGGGGGGGGMPDDGVGGAWGSAGTASGGDTNTPWAWATGGWTSCGNCDGGGNGGTGGKSIKTYFPGGAISPLQSIQIIVGSGGGGGIGVLGCYAGTGNPGSVSVTVNY